MEDTTERRIYVGRLKTHSRQFRVLFIYSHIDFSIPLIKKIMNFDIQFLCSLFLVIHVFRSKIFEKYKQMKKILNKGSFRKLNLLRFCETENTLWQ